MDIDEVRVTRSRQLVRADDLEPVSRVRLLPITARTSSLEDFSRWNIQDRVTISGEARRRYKKMLESEQNPAEK